jgi:hypothetical protein
MVKRDSIGRTTVIDDYSQPRLTWHWTDSSCVLETTGVSGRARSEAEELCGPLEKRSFWETDNGRVSWPRGPISISRICIAIKSSNASWGGGQERVRLVMASRRRQLEEVIARTKHPIIRMQLTELLSREVQRQNWVVRKAEDALDCLSPQAIGRLPGRAQLVLIAVLAALILSIMFVMQ